MNVVPAEFQVPAIIRADNATAVRQAGERFVDEGPAEIEISLAALAANNSIVIALLLAWVRRARARGKVLRFVAVPDDLRNIIELYGVTEILPLDGAGSPAGTAWAVEDDEPAAAAALPPEQEST